MKCQKIIKNRILSFVTELFHVEYTLSSTKNGPQVQCLCILELVSNPRLRLFSKTDVKKTLSSILNEKSCCYMKSLREVLFCLVSHMVFVFAEFWLISRRLLDLYNHQKFMHNEVIVVRYELKVKVYRIHGFLID